MPKATEGTDLRSAIENQLKEMRDRNQNPRTIYMDRETLAKLGWSHDYIPSGLYIDGVPVYFSFTMAGYHII